MFRNRTDAGRRLGALLRDRLGEPVPAVDEPDGSQESGVLVVGLPRGGVPVAMEVGRALAAPVDVILVRKLGVPWHRELAMGAIGEDGVIVTNDDVIAGHRVTTEQFEQVVATERKELARRAQQLRGSRRAQAIAGRDVVVVDDGIATGATAHAACVVARARGARRVVLAVPVAPPRWDVDLGDAADEYVAVETPAGFRAVGAHYHDFHPVTDDDVSELLAVTDPG